MTHIMSPGYISVSTLTTIDPDSYDSLSQSVVIATLQREHRFYGVILVNYFRLPKVLLEESSARWCHDHNPSPYGLTVKD